MTRTRALLIAAALLLHLAACGGGGDGGNTGGSGGSGGGGSGPTCPTPGVKVLACALPTPKPATPDTPWAFTSPGTVTAVRAGSASDPCVDGNDFDYVLGAGAAPEVLVDLSDGSGNTLTVGFAVPGFTSGSVAVGDLLDVDFSFKPVEFGGKHAHLEILRGGQSVVAVGENETVGLSLGEGKSECRHEDELCAREAFEMVVTALDGSSAAIPNGTTTEVGTLTVTNDHYFHNEDTSGGCDYGLPVEYLVGVAPTP